MRERRGGAAEFRIVPMHACDLHAVVGRKIMCAGARWGWLRAGGVAEGRPVHPVRASGPGTRSYRYASALRGPSRARPRRALHCVHAARGLSRDPAAFISLQSSALAVTGAGWSLRFTNNGIHNPLNCFVTLIINKRLGITCTRTRACVLHRPRRARGYIIATVGRSGSFHRALLHLGKHEADDHLAAVLGAEDLECVVGLAVAWLEQAHAAARTRSRIVERSVQPPLSRPFFRFYPVFDTGNSPAPQAISVTSKPNVATERAGRARQRSYRLHKDTGPGRARRARAEPGRARAGRSWRSLRHAPRERRRRDAQHAHGQI